MRLQLPLILSGEQACFEGTVGPHLCAEKDKPFLCAHRVNGTSPGFGPELDRLARIGIPIPDDLRSVNERFCILMTERDHLAHRIAGLAGDQSVLERHRAVTESAATQAQDLHGTILDLAIEYFVPRDECNK